ncbi:MAG: 8-oxoguanine DNA glycosylase [Clostridia bacterium BRH_c25]|nr:MAG: 8-oxoguanine DNA glycosylase [Clostridia bacterium BRH_c25]
MKITEVENGLILEDLTAFDARHIFECGQCFRWAKEEDGSYTGIAFGRVLNVRSDYDKGMVMLDNTSLKEFQDIWFEYFDLGRDYGVIKETLSRDPVLDMAIKYGRGIRILKQEPWELLISYIMSANNSIPMIARSIGLLSEMYGSQVHYKGKAYYTFPTPEELYSAGIEGISLCRAGFRCKYILQAAAMVNAGETRLEEIAALGIDNARKELMKIPGVGPKVADCIMLFSMQKYKAYPVDVWVKRVTEYFFLGRDVKMKEIQHFAEEKFGDMAGFAQEYLFYYARESKINPDKRI